MSRWGLRARIGALVVAAAIAPLAISTALAWRSAHALVEEQAVAILGVRADQLAGEIDAFNFFYLASAQRLARLPAAARAASGESSAAADLRQALLAWPETDGHVFGAEVADPSGRVIASTRAEGLSPALAGRAFFRQAVGGAAAVSDVFVLEPASGRVPLVVYAAPVTVAGGPPRAVVLLVLRATAFWDVVRRGNDRAGAGGFAVLTDAAGIRLAHGVRDDLLFRPLGPLPPEALEALVREQRFGERTRALLTSPAGSPEELARATSQAPPPPGLFTVDDGGSGAHVAVARRIASASWTLFYSVPARVLSEAAGRLVWSFAPGLLLAAAAFAAALTFAGRIARPLTLLAGAFERVARGERAAVAPQGAGELARLAESFNGMAAAVAASRTDLEARVRQRTEDLTRANAELEAQKEELVAQRHELLRRQGELVEKSAEVQRADRLKSEFLANMSHELRTPLSAIIGFSDLVAEEEASRLTLQAARYLGEVRASGRHLLGLINDILDLSKIEAGHLELELQAVEPGAAIAEATGLMVAAAKEKELDLRGSTGSARAVRADPARLRQILLNLLANAVKFTPRGGVVEVGASDEGARVRFSVRDSGPGVDEAVRASLFQPFVQGEAPLVKKHQGTGLGLHICKRLVELQAGELSFESAPGRGATFSFTLPAEETAAPGGRPLVLLVEENAEAARELQAWLEGEGFLTVHVGADTNVRDLAARLRPAAVVLDPAAEHRDGFLLLDDLKRRKETRDIPVVVSSTPAATAFIPKPPVPEQVLGIVAESAPPRAGGVAPTVLAIDDDEGARAVLRSILEPAGYRVLVADGGRSGLALALAERPAIVIADLLMPDLSGFEVVTALAADDRTCDIPVVVLTAATLTADERCWLAARVRSVEQKGDATRIRLLEAVRRAIARRPAPARGSAGAVVIDDNDAGRELAAALLERRGWRVLRAGSGDEGLAAVRRERPALVVCDIAMPGKDGYAVARELRADPSTARVPLVALSALAMAGDRERALSAGFDAYLTKPLDAGALDAALRALDLGHEPTPRVAVAAAPGALEG